jgi:FkbM family methyltransferase
MTATRTIEPNGILHRMRRFLQKPRQEKIGSLCLRWVRTFPKIPVPVRLPFGAWWLARNDHVSLPIIEGKFETAELAFLNRFLRPGMTVLDLGAHHGFYTLLASKRVGNTGNVFSFEPSPRERKALRLHLRLNRCKNVVIQEMALGDQNTDSALYVVEDWAAGCNSLRPPDVAAKTSPVPVHVVRLDDWLAEHKIDRVDFIKLDVEGAELTILKGAQGLLNCGPRPVILAEVQDVRTLPWGYRARKIVTTLEELGYLWFQLSAQGSLLEIDPDRDAFEANLVAIPDELTHEVLSRFGSGSKE